MVKVGLGLALWLLLAAAGAQAYNTGDVAVLFDLALIGGMVVILTLACYLAGYERGKTEALIRGRRS